jgi:hypothetical protein
MRSAKPDSGDAARFFLGEAGHLHDFLMVSSYPDLPLDLADGLGAREEFLLPPAQFLADRLEPLDGGDGLRLLGVEGNGGLVEPRRSLLYVEVESALAYPRTS